jgi:hypothetical protein
MKIKQIYEVCGQPFFPTNRTIFHMIFYAAENLFISFEVGFGLITVIREIPHEFLSK